MSAKNGHSLETAGEHLVRMVTERGFEPSRVSNAFFIEFHKTYADSQGRLARATVQFEKPGVVGGALRLSGFSVLVQAHVEASREAVLERAPPVVQEDLLRLVEVFGGTSATVASAAMAIERCSMCRAAVSEFFVVAGAVRCRVCKEG